MSNKFGGSTAGEANLDDGTTPIFASTLGAASFTPSTAVKTGPTGLLTSTDLDVTDVSGLQTTLNGKLDLSGGTMTGNLVMSGAGISGLSDATTATEPATKSQLDGKLSLSGGTMTGNLSIGTNTISGDTTSSVVRCGVSDVSYVQMTERATPGAPDATKYQLYFKSDGNLYKQNSAGTETEIGAGSSLPLAGGTMSGDIDMDGNAVVDAEYVDFEQIATPANPGSGIERLYFKSDGRLYSQNNAGTETQIGEGVFLNKITGGSVTGNVTIVKVTPTLTIQDTGGNVLEVKTDSSRAEYSVNTASMEHGFVVNSNERFTISDDEITITDANVNALVVAPGTPPTSFGAVGTLYGGRIISVQAGEAVTIGRVVSYMIYTGLSGAEVAVKHVVADQEETVASSRPIGVALNSASIGQAVKVAVAGITRINCENSFSANAGGLVTCAGTSGRVTMANFAASNKVTIGVAMEAGSFLVDDELLVHIRGGTEGY